jgi:hypothetical protein
MKRMLPLMLLTLFAAGVGSADGGPLPPPWPPKPPCQGAGCGAGGGGGGGFVIVVPTTFGGAITITVPRSIAHRLRLV